MIFIACLYFVTVLFTIFCSILSNIPFSDKDLLKLKNRRVHFKNSGMKGLINDGDLGYHCHGGFFIVDVKV